MATRMFRSSLAPYLQSFLEIRRASGRHAVASQKMLSYIDHFLVCELGPGQTITREIAERYIDSVAYLRAGTRLNRVSMLRQFCLYLHHFDPRTCLVHRSFVPHRTRPAPYIYSNEEVRAIIAAARAIGPPRSLRPAVIAALLGLLASTGLRIGEALNLTLADVDLRRRLLLIRETKFGKSRYVPLSSSTARHLTAFLRRRKRAGLSTDPAGPVFVTPSGRAYGEASACAIFLQIVRQIGLRGPKGQKGPRLHDFRHAFAVNRLLAWYREGANLGAKLPLLSTYLGHATVTSTEVYLHATAELLEQADKRFHSHFAVPTFRGREPLHEDRA